MFGSLWDWLRRLSQSVLCSLDGTQGRWLLPFSGGLLWPQSPRPKHWRKPRNRPRLGSWANLLLLLWLPLLPAHGQSSTQQSSPQSILPGQKPLQSVTLTEDQFKAIVKTAVDKAVDDAVQAAVAEEQGKAAAVQQQLDWVKGEVARLQVHEAQGNLRLWEWTAGAGVVGALVGGLLVALLVH